MDINVIKLMSAFFVLEGKNCFDIPGVSSLVGKLEEDKTSFNSENDSWEKRKSFDLH